MDDDDERATVSILLLGDPGCGKTTFLSAIVPTWTSRLSQGVSSPHTRLPASSPLLRDLDQPFPFDIRLYNRHYRFEFSDTASPENWTLHTPDFAILCYDISDRRSLHNAAHVWRKAVARHHVQDREEIPVMLLGLKRDLRLEEGDKRIVDPQEGYRVAQEMRCDRYAECSAVTGELMKEAMEDVARTAAKTTTEEGGTSLGGCALM
ncbi:MAG: hypothetical protein HETSPECPRED_008379 [Heterodermia speciosa]|uniref:P-loop containing nucleoside triphosphate hydrolase protein n=1 Tax=Heterodermia speciosa TaxID=116794 RepID=A0A8H3IT64_9LECA|nr:MAG: hypothetical protein HETSPECPRED_008379 [Heterodermia speciosa]